MAGVRRNPETVTRHRKDPTAAAVAMLLLPASAAAHAPSVTNEEASSPDEAIVLEDPTLSRGIVDLISFFNAPWPPADAATEGTD